MMTAWDILTANSTAAPGSDAWTHLNSQAGGDTVIISGPFNLAEHYRVGLAAVSSSTTLAELKAAPALSAVSARAKIITVGAKGEH